MPIGGIFELVYHEDNPRNRLVDWVPLDGATCFPTFDPNKPIIQRVGKAFTNPVIFPAYAVNRIYYNPRREIEWRGWGTPPPQFVYMAIQMISRGDNYYWKLLNDTPSTGILDLMDMSKEDAQEWIEAFRSLMTGIDPFKIPVLYQHMRRFRNP